MNKRQYRESRESIAYYSGLNGLEIKDIEPYSAYDLEKDQDFMRDEVKNTPTWTQYERESA